MKALSRRQLAVLVSVLVGGAVFAVVLVVPSVSTVLLVSFGIAYVLDPVVDALEGRKLRGHTIGRTTAIVGLLAASVLAIAIVVLVVVPGVQGELAHLLQDLPRWIDHARIEWLPRVAGLAGMEGEGSLADALAQLGERVRSLPVDTMAPITGHVLASVFQSTLSVLVFVFNAAMVPVFSFYLLREIDEIKERISELVPPDIRGALFPVLADIDAALAGFLRGQVTVCVVLAGLYGFGLSLVGLKLAWLIGLIAGLANIIPYLGLMVGLSTALAVGALQFQALGPLLLIGLVFGFVQFLEGFVITPRVMGDKLGLHPLAVIVSLMAFGELLGFVGVLLGVPLAAIANVLLTEGLRRYEASRIYATASISAASGASDD